MNRASNATPEPENAAVPDQRTQLSVPTRAQRRAMEWLMNLPHEFQQAQTGQLLDRIKTDMQKWVQSDVVSQDGALPQVQEDAA
jgi:hypothetical protein